MFSTERTETSLSCTVTHDDLVYSMPKMVPFVLDLLPVLVHMLPKFPPV